MIVVPCQRKWRTFRTCWASAILVLAFYRQPRGGIVVNHRWSFSEMGNRLLGDYGFAAAQNTTTQEDTDYESLASPSRRATIYSKLRKDQAGWVIYDMLKAHSYAFAMNMTYGGACGESLHKQDIYNVLSSIGWKDILPLACPKNDTVHRVYPGSFFERDHGNRIGDMKWRNFVTDHTDYSYFDHPRENNDNENPKDLRLKPFSIVVHIRRRDVTPCCYPHWYLPNSYFASMIEKHYMEQVHDPKKDSSSSRPIQVQIFSQSESHESWDDLQNKIPSHVNYTLHLDGPVGEVWKAIVSSDVFVGSISEFSRVPAMFARGLVPNPGNISDVRIASETKQETQRLLHECGEAKIVQCKHKWWMKNKR